MTIIVMVDVLMQFTRKALRSFETAATFDIFTGLWIRGFYLFTSIPYPRPDRFA